MNSLFVVFELQMSLSDISYLALLASSHALLQSVECMIITAYTQHFDDSNASGQQWSLENIPTDIFLYICSLLHAESITSLICFHGTLADPKH